ncbi:MAG: dTDP-4-dehydrorhamnose 3,5-epimerase family protein [Candidatus Vogelbacteria bacterium]|nr:dTDP-4-dehydrorhamnose 3,5-epimerase family protein [Candidatus Vogelbacteria bacterium]
MKKKTGVPSAISGGIDGVVILPLRRIPDVRGTIMHGVRCDTALGPIGEVYFKKLYRGIINGWHVHDTLELNYICLQGMMRLVLYDMRKKSSTYKKCQEICYGDDNYVLVHIPPGIANASETLSRSQALMCNIASEPHDPNAKYRRIDPLSNEIPFDWSKRNF